MTAGYEIFRPPSLEEALLLATRIDDEATRLEGSATSLRSFGAAFGAESYKTDRFVEAIERDVARMRRAAEILTWIARRADRLHELNRPRQPAPHLAGNQRR